MATIYKYSESTCGIEENVSLPDFYNGKGLEAGNFYWINVDRESKSDIDKLCEELSLHPLLVEDIFSKNTLPKFEMFEELAFLKLEMVRRHDITKELQQEHLSLICSENLVVSIQDMKMGDPFNGVRHKLNVNYKRVSHMGIEYLYLSMIDAVVDEYLASVENFREPLEDLETSMVKRPHTNSIRNILEIKTEINKIRKITVPLRDELQRMRADAPKFIKKSNQVFYRDIIDHLGVLYVNFETFREMLRDLTELQNSNQNLMLNNTMKTLTVISAIFIPLTFIVGVYGMNVDMPEQHFKHPYLFIWSILILVSLSLSIYMKKKRWF